MNSILVTGSMNMDLVVRSPRHPKPGETLLGGEFATFPGGKGANQAVAAARLGAPVAMIGRAGNDAFGDQLVATLASDLIDTTWIVRDDDTRTGVALITVADSGENTIVVAPGANGKVSPEQVRASAPAFDQARILLLQLEIPLPAVRQAIQQARERNIAVILNPAPVLPLTPELLAQVDYLIPNQSELTLLSGMDAVSDPVRAAESLYDKGIRRVIVTLGSEGVLVIEKGQEAQRLPAYRVPVVDTTAAGDAFVGAFAVALAEGRSTIEAARWGNAAGALAVGRPGAQPSLPIRAEFDAFLAEKA